MKILVADDTKNIRMLLSRCLEMEGHEVTTAENGEQALKCFQNNSFDLAFLDIKMPIISGTEVLKQIRQLGINTPAIIITAYATIKNAVDCMQFGAVAYLQKPFTVERIKSVLSELMVEKFENNTDIKLSKVDELMKNAEYEKAAFLLKQLLPDASLNPEIYKLLADVNHKLNQHAEADKYARLYEAIK
jgi:two-component system OmpR family response regulator